MYVVCECAAKILLVPDLEEMARSIVTHAEKHAKKETDPENRDAERLRIEELLTEKVLKLVSECETDFVAINNLT